MSIGQLTVASPTQTASPVVLFRAVPQDAGLNLQTPGQRDDKPPADLELKGRSRKVYSLPTEHESKGRFTQRTSINESHEPPSE